MAHKTMEKTGSPVAAQHNLPGLAAFFIGVFFLFWLIVTHASVTEDAYITFRVVDQFVHGNGLRWNLDERVQVYTNPLWMLLHIPFFAIWDNIEAVTLLLSFACAAVAVTLPAFTLGRSPFVALAFFVVPLMASRAFIEYSTSGLENPLGHALFACFGWMLLQEPSKRRWFLLSLITALSLVNRLDTAVFYAPIWAYLLASQARQIPWRQIFAGAAPIVLWELFSLFYYGFPFPNTKYAKLDTAISQAEYFTRGASYVLNLATSDPFSFVCLLLAFIGLPRLLWKWRKGNDPLAGRYLFLALSILVYSVYVFSVGGARQSGRFWSLPVYASIWLLYASAVASTSGARARAGLAVIAIVFLLFYPPTQAIYARCKPCFAGMASPDQADFVKLHGVANAFRRDRPLQIEREDKFKVMTRLGEYGYRSSLDTIILDPLGIGDPLLARLPSFHADMRFAGHAWRALPRGYAFARQIGNISEMNRDLADYYSKLKIIVSGELWSWERLQTIVAFNLGAYDDARQRYVERMPKRSRKN